MRSILFGSCKPLLPANVASPSRHQSSMPERKKNGELLSLTETLLLIYKCKSNINDATLGTVTNFGGASTTSPNFIFSHPGKSKSSSVLAFLCLFFFASTYLHELRHNHQLFDKCSMHLLHHHLHQIKPLLHSLVHLTN